MTLHLEQIADLQTAREVWEPLAERSGNVFSTWDWAVAWWQAFGRDHQLRLAALRDDGGAAVAVLPLYEAARRPMRTLRFIGNGPADQLGPVCDPERLDEVVTALRRELDQGSFPWAVLVAERLRGDHDWRALLGGRTVARESSPVMRTEGRNWEEYLAMRSRNFRDQVRRRERKLAREHDLRFRLTTSDRFDEDFATVVRLHDLRWGDVSQAFAGPLEAFHSDFARRALERGWLRLWVMEVDELPVAAWYGYRFGSVESYYNSGRDPSWDKHRVGFVLLTHTMRAAFDDGMREYRMLRGGEQYKDRFATDDPGIETVALTRGMGRAVWGVGAAARRLVPSRAKPRLKRLMGL